MPSMKITKTTVDKAEAKSTDYFIWDTDLTGFGIRITPSAKKTYVVKYRDGRGRRAPTRRLSIGRHGAPWTPDLARAEARRVLSEVVQGHDPANDRARERNSLTVLETCELYLREGVHAKKASTIDGNKTFIKRHIGPLIGNQRIQDICRADIYKLMADIAAGKTAVDVRTGPRGRAIVTGGKVTANNVAALLSTIYNFAIERGLTLENPVKGVKRYPSTKRERFLSKQEFEALGKVLELVESRGVNPYAIAIIRLLALTGARCGEITNLLWEEVDFERNMLRLKDSKTGAKVIFLPSQAVDIIAGQPRLEGCAYVFPGTDGKAPYKGVPKIWRRIRFLANLRDVRLHDLRHSHASVAAAQGVPLAVISRVLGHKRSATTERYAHLCDDPVRASTEAIGNSIFQQLTSGRM